MTGKVTYYSVDDPSAMPVAVEPYTFRVSPFPAGTDEGRLWATWIKYAGDNQWFVLSAYQQEPPEFLDRDGRWVYRSGAKDQQIKHSFEDAERLARAAVLDIRIGGLTVEDAANRRYR